MVNRRWGREIPKVHQDPAPRSAIIPQVGVLRMLDL